LPNLITPTRRLHSSSSLHNLSSTSATQNLLTNNKTNQRCTLPEDVTTVETPPTRLPPAPPLELPLVTSADSLDTSPTPVPTPRPLRPVTPAVNPATSLPSAPAVVLLPEVPPLLVLVTSADSPATWPVTAPREVSPATVVLAEPVATATTAVDSVTEPPTVLPRGATRPGRRSATTVSSPATGPTSAPTSESSDPL